MLPSWSGSRSYYSVFDISCTMLLGALLIQGLLLPCGAAPSEMTAREDVLPIDQPLGGPYDSRFAKGELPYAERNTTLRNLVRTYLSTFNDLGVETWLMHSTLLGWWWGKHVLPWELDVSVQVSEPGIFFLAAYYNMSSHSFKTPGTRNRRRYLLELSPYAKDREQADRSHPADARWIDVETGLALNIYAVRYHVTHSERENMLSYKDGSELMDTYLFPLRSTTFEGVPAKIPYRYRELLTMEYGVDALKGTERNNHHFDKQRMQWVLKEEPEHPAPEDNLMVEGGTGNNEL